MIVCQLNAFSSVNENTGTPLQSGTVCVCLCVCGRVGEKMSSDSLIILAAYGGRTERVGEKRGQE